MLKRSVALLAATACWAIAQSAVALPFVSGLSNTLSAAPVHYVGPCPGTITFHGRVRVAGRIPPGASVEIGYQFSRSDGGTGPNQFLSATHPGFYDVTDTWTLGGAPLPSFSGWEHFKTWVTDSAEGGGKPPVWSNEAHFTLTCAQPGSPHGSGGPNLNPGRQ
jgi:hypothetical protein